MRSSAAARFAAKAKVNYATGCIEWQAAKDNGGYGMFRINGRTLRAHRFSYEANVGEIPEDMCVCHRCDNRICVNPNHLFLGSLADNVADMDAKGRRSMPLGERHGCSKLVDADVIAIRRATGGHGLLTKLAEQYGISRPQISNIRSGKNWTHL